MLKDLSGGVSTGNRVFKSLQQKRKGEHVPGFPTCDKDGAISSFFL
jgi:hypothetical protein